MEINKLCTYLAKKIVPEEKNNNEDIEIITYGISALLTTIINFSTSFTLASLLGVKKEMIYLYMIFIPLRTFSNGYHCKTFIRCLCVTNCVYIICCFLIKSLYSLKIPFIFFMILNVLNYYISAERNKYGLFIFAIAYLINKLYFHIDIVFLVAIILNIFLIQGGKINEKKFKSSII